MLDLGVWMQQSVDNRYTALGQDVAYALPGSIWPCVLLHGLIATALSLPPAKGRPSPSRAEASAPPSLPSSLPSSGREAS